MRTLALLTFLLAALPAAAAPTRLKELVDVQGMRDNELFGYGLVVGLAGTGDNERSFTSQSVAAMLGRLGVRVDPRDVRARNVAAVMVTARFSTFSRPGTHIDVTVASMGNARSLAGGVLLVTPLQGADGQVYAVAQGSVQVGGYQAGAAGTSLTKNGTSTGRVPQGATVERAVTVDLTKGPIVLQLKRPDFATASRVAKAVGGVVGAGNARALDAAAVEVKPQGEQQQDVVGLLAQLEALEVDADGRARLVINERTGTVVAGERVRLRPAVVAHGGLQVAITQRTTVSQPAPFGQGTTVATPEASVLAEEGRNGAVALPATATVEELAAALNRLGATPRDLIAILQALEAAGALDAELEVL